MRVGEREQKKEGILGELMHSTECRAYSGGHRSRP